ncbi:patatin-like phospholipase domain-containing protein 2 [Solea solea]|uniref:patatin-like phospholipase domain-containing protein 2 n=1 Tax=Solea solea TaxID=90069 RepID=UPI00272BA888|nr:patatin-like phospholipase domain-containing protein 2 [Solea solea]
MEPPERTFCWDEEWNISFAGCGFRSMYHMGAMCCVLERIPQLVHGASKICGASSGCLVAAALTVGIPIEQFCMDVMTMAKEARRHTLGVFHPTFSLLRRVRVFLLEKLPEDAHLRASGKLCVSLTRMSDGKNVLVSEFDSREELIQVLMCSCFFPLYCGFIPPSYRGVHYMDGALSNNMPLLENRNTITVAPFSGESDICPKEGTLNFCEVHYGNVSIQVNTGNVHRICTSFLPPRPEKLAEIFHNGYKDALRFLREKDLLGTQCRPPSLVAQMDKPNCCESMRKVARADVTKKILLDRLKPTQETDHWPDQDVIANLPAEIERILCEACRESGDGVSWSWLTDFLPIKVVLYLLTILMLPVELILFLTKSIIEVGYAVLCSLFNSATPKQQCSKRSMDTRQETGDINNRKPLTSVINRGSNNNLHWDDNSNLNHKPGRN